MPGLLSSRPAACRTGASSSDTARSWSSERAPSAKSDDDQVLGGRLDEGAALVGDLGEHGAAVLRMRAAYDEPAASSRCTIEVTDVGCTCSRSPILPSGSEPREEKTSSTSAS